MYSTVSNILFSYRITDPSQRENLGIIVHYKVKVKLCLGPLGGDVVAELPFILMHPKPLEEVATTSSNRSQSAAGASDGNDANEDEANENAEENLIQLDA